MRAVVRPSSRDDRNADTHVVQTSKIGKVQFLILLDRFEREESKNGLSLCVFVDNDILHPAVWCTAVVLHRKSAYERESVGEYKPRTG